jgi:histone-binding protein RBBP4
MSEPKSRGTNPSVNMDGLGFSDRDENLLIKEEYKIWKNNCPHLYDVVSTHALKWPSLTIQWFPTIDEQRNKNYSFHEILLGTQTLGEDPNYLIKAEVGLPLEISDDDNDNNNVADGAINNNFRIVKMIKHSGNVNIARYMPQKPSIIASKNDGDEVYIFDCNEQSSMPSNGRVNPELRLLGHKTEGFSLSWSIFKSGHLLSGANDSLVCWWDTNATTQNRTLDPLRVFKV